MKKLRFKRIVSLLLSAVMVCSFIPASSIDFANGSNASKASASTRYDSVSFKNVTGSVDLSAIQIANFSDKVMEVDSEAVQNMTRTVIIGLNQPSVLETMPEGADVANYLTSVAGKKTVNGIEQSQKAFLNDLKNRGVNYTLVDSYNTVINAVAISVKLSELSLIKGLSAVSMAVVSETYAAPETVEEEVSSGAQSNPSNVYGTGIYDTSDYLDYKYDEGLTVAVLDTGLDYTHSAFQTQPEVLGLNKDEVASVVSSLKATERSSLAGDTLTADDLYVSDKIPYAYDYADDDADVYPSYSNHGSHVAGIIGGQDTYYTDKDGNIVNDTFMGAAPNAQLVICKVFTDDLDSSDLGGAVAEDILAALEDCVTLGVDVINMSLGTSAGFSSISVEGDSEGLLFNTVYGNIKANGISLIAAASNDYSSGFGSAFGTNLASNPDSGTVGSPSTFVGAMSVASINGQLSPFMTVDVNGKAEAIFYHESTDENSVENDFAEEMLGASQSGKFKYVMIPGVGQAVNYSSSIKSLLADKSQGPVIAVIQRGLTTFEEKVELAVEMGADAVIVYNNVAGTVRMNLGDLEKPVPAVSVSIDAGQYLNASAGSDKVGEITIDKTNQAGPFMNDYSSWGATPDLKLKPDITAHGGEIISTVPGGYDMQSGTSMASPNMAAVVAQVRGYLKKTFPNLNNVELTTLTNQIIMSTATTVYDEEHLPYSPRKQGAGLATLDNIFGTSAYLYTVEAEGGAEDNRPKIELGEDEEKTGVYNLKFYVKNFGTEALNFKLTSMFFTETLAKDGYAVAESAYMLDGSPVFKINEEVPSTDTITVAGGETAKIEVTLTLSAEDHKYINKTFENGMFVEGFIKLVSETDGQCDLNIPFMGFYGDWEAAPMLDYDAFEIAEFEQDNQYNDTNRPKEQVWATQAYSMYYNNRYVLPMGSFVYLQDENADQIYTTEEYAAISGFNDFYGDEDFTNYMTSTGIKALYAGLLRNAELVTYNLYDVNTGELIVSDREYRVGKAYAGGGQATPAQVLLEKTPEDWGLQANGKYKLEFKFWFNAEDAEDPSKQDLDNSFEMSFYVDYEAPVLVESRIRYYDYKDGNKTKQRVYLDLDIFDNHYTQAILLCLSETDNDITKLNLATEYVIPVYRPNKNGITTVSIEITDIIDEDIANRLYVQIDDYALNHNIYQIGFNSANGKGLPDTFEVANGTEITLAKNTTHKVALSYEGSANLSNFTWSTNKASVAIVKNGEIFGVKPGEATITASANGVTRKIKVTVVDSDKTLALPSISFGTIQNHGGSELKAQGLIEVSAGKTFTLPVIIDPWYYPENQLKLKWKSSNEKIATVDQNGNVKTNSEEGTATISAIIMDGERETLYSATVVLDVQDPFTVNNFTLERYNGDGGVVVIPDNENIMTIGEEAFIDNDNVTAVIIPKTVRQIDVRAFKNCTALEYVYFVSEDKLPVRESALSLIYEQAFIGCTSLKMVDFTNVKIATLDRNVFTGCTSLTEIKGMENIGTIHDSAFGPGYSYNDDGELEYLNGCTSLKSVNLTNLHMTGSSVFEGCTSLTEVITSKNTVLGENMFERCTALEEVVINCPVVPAYAFMDCGKLETVSFGDASASTKDTVFTINDSAFINCGRLTEVNFNGYKVAKIGDSAFENCSYLASFTLPGGSCELGRDVFKNCHASFELVAGSEYETLADGSIYNGTTLVSAPETVTAEFTIKAGTTAIASYAFAGSKLASGVTTFTIPESVTSIGEGAFYGLNITSLALPRSVTTISEGAFSGTSITSFTVNKEVTSINAMAFANALSLATIEFEAGSTLKTIGDMAFSRTALTSVTLPDGASVMGSMVFRQCEALETVVLPSVTQLGRYTFLGCTALDTVTYGANATVTGVATFAEGYEYSFTGAVLYSCSVKTVNLSDTITKIDEACFYGSAITAIDLKNVTVLDNSAFEACRKLTSVTGLNEVVKIGNFAFLQCTSLDELNLSAVEELGVGAFANTNLTSITLSSVKVIGDSAFYQSKLSEITLPQSVEYVGSAVFAGAERLKTIKVADGNESYFAEDGVLYRNITDFKTGELKYELVSYPAGKYAMASNGKTTIFIKEGTVTIKAYALAELAESVAQKVVIPYSVKTIGSGAFALSGISEYHFEAITAPKLLNEMMSMPAELEGFHGLTYNNFESNLLNYVNLSDFNGATSSTLAIYYPTNGAGYDNYVYDKFFGVKQQLGELIDDTTRSVKTAIEGFVSAETVATWATAEVTDAKKAEIIAFSDAVKEAHRLYNSITSETQLGYLITEDGDLAEKLFAIESALKTVKARFGILVRVTSLTVDPTSTHKTAYKAGEKFDITGLKLIITYDDYSTEIADMSKITIGEEYAGELTEYNRYVVVSGYGASVRVPVTVTVSAGDDVSPEDTGCNSSIASIEAGVAFVVLIAIGAIILIKKVKKENA